MDSNGKTFVPSSIKIRPAVLELKYVDGQIDVPYKCSRYAHHARTHKNMGNAILLMRHIVFNYVSQLPVKVTFRTNENLGAKLTGCEAGCVHIPSDR
jgi:hypothetical protein